MRVLDLDMDYFMTSVAISIDESTPERLDEEYYRDAVWSEEQVRSFLESNLGLSKQNKICGRIVSGHNEALYFWQELITKRLLCAPFEVIHIDSHADLGLGYSSYRHIQDVMLKYPVNDRPNYSKYLGVHGDQKDVGIGDYLLYAVAYRWIDKIVYCGNPCGECNDYIFTTLKDFHEEMIWDKPVHNVIQLLHNPNECEPDSNDYFNDHAYERAKAKYIRNSIKEPEVPFLIIPTIEDVHFDGDFDFAVLAQSPNYTPESADFIMDIFREYISEI